MIEIVLARNTNPTHLPHHTAWHLKTMQIALQYAKFWCRQRIDYWLILFELITLIIFFSSSDLSSFTFHVALTTYILQAFSGHFTNYIEGSTYYSMEIGLKPALFSTLFKLQNYFGSLAGKWRISDFNLFLIKGPLIPLIALLILYETHMVRGLWMLLDRSPQTFIHLRQLFSSYVGLPVFVLRICVCLLLCVFLFPFFPFNSGFFLWPPFLFSIFLFDPCVAVIVCLSWGWKYHWHSIYTMGK